MSTDEIRLVIPAEEDFRPIVHLVTGGRHRMCKR